MLAKTHEALIAQAQEATRNKFTASHINAAHARLIEVVICNLPPAFDPLSDDCFADAKEYLSNLASVMDEVVYQVMREARTYSHRISKPDHTVISDALHDANVTGELNNATEEAANERAIRRAEYSEHNTMHRALQGA